MQLPWNAAPYGGALQGNPGPFFMEILDKVMRSLEEFCRGIYLEGVLS